MNQKKYYIYRIINKINGKDYIGKHIYLDYKNPLNDGYFGSGINIKKAIKKYGKNNFEKEILIDNILTEEEANSLEKILIEEYKNNDLAIYNIAKGGDGGNNIVWTEEKRKEISKRFKGHHPSLETREKMSKNNGMLGKHHTKETIEKISKNRKGKSHSHTEEEKKKIGLKSKINNNIKYVRTEKTRKKAIETMKNRIWVNNGEEEKLVKEIPNGYIKGRLKKEHKK